MGKALQLFRNKALYVVVLSVVLSLALMAFSVSGASTISTDISTGGKITADGNIHASSTANALMVTGQARFYSQIVLRSQAANPTADATGGLFFDSDDRVLKVYDGVDWRVVASTTSSQGLIIGSGNGVRFNTIEDGYMALGTSTLPVATTTLITTAGQNPLLFLNSTTTATVPLMVAGFVGQTGDLVRIFKTTAAGGHIEVFALDSLGNASTTILSTTARVVDALVISGYATTSGSTGNFATEGTLIVTGAQTFTGAMSANGNVTLGDALADVITITGAASTTNSLNVGTVFSVRGMSTTTARVVDELATTTIGSVLGSSFGIGTSSPAKHFSLVGDAYMTGGLGIGVINSTDGTLVVNGATTLTGALTANGNVTLGDTVDDAISIPGAASTTNSLNVGTVFSVRGMSTTTARVVDELATTTIGSVLGSSFGIGTSSPAKHFSLVGDAYMTGGLGIGVINSTDGTLVVNGVSTFTGTLTTNGTLTANGNVTLGDTVDDIITITGAATTTNSLNVGTVFSVRGNATTTVDFGETSATTTLGRTGEIGGGGALGIGTTTPTRGAKLGVVGDVTVSNTLGTTTMRLHAEQTLFGSCIQMKASDNTLFRIYATSTGAMLGGGYRGLVIEAGQCE